MRILYTLVVGYFLLMVGANSAVSESPRLIVIIPERNFVLEGEQQMLPTVIELIGNKKLESTILNEGVSFTVITNNRIVTRVKVSLEGVSDTRYEVYPLILAIPFYENGALRIILAPVYVDSGSRAVREIYATNVRELRTENLPLFYQRARSVAEQRRNDLGGQWNNLHDYDVQSVFKYLEVVTEISNKLYVIPPHDVSSARDWLLNAVSNRPRRVEQAVGLENARSMIREIDATEGVRFSRLWNQIIEVTDCSRRLPLLEAYRKLLEEAAPKQRRDEIIRVTGVPFAVVESARAQCTVTKIKDDIIAPQEAEEQLEAQIHRLRAEKSTTFTETLLKLLDGDIATLENMKAKLHY